MLYTLLPKIPRTRFSSFSTPSSIVPTRIPFLRGRLSIDQVRLNFKPACIPVGVVRRKWPAFRQSLSSRHLTEQVCGSERRA
ncbi:hypothetical protein C8Q77DRAFT_170195 [Trametes polyzona]|nr:hypothetical protein C8Q77DRAFT_170195 [Trametes polyzona]